MDENWILIIWPKIITGYIIFFITWWCIDSVLKVGPMTRDNTEMTASGSEYTPSGDGLEMYIIQLLIFGNGVYDWSVSNVNINPPEPLEVGEVLISRDLGKIFNYSVWLERHNHTNAFLFGTMLIEHARIKDEEVLGDVER